MARRQPRLDVKSSVSVSETSESPSYWSTSSAGAALRDDFCLLLLRVWLLLLRFFLASPEEAD